MKASGEEVCCIVFGMMVVGGFWLAWAGRNSEDRWARKNNAMAIERCPARDEVIAILDSDLPGTAEDDGMDRVDRLDFLCRWYKDSYPEKKSPTLTDVVRAGNAQFGE